MSATVLITAREAADSLPGVRSWARLRRRSSFPARIPYVVLTRVLATTGARASDGASEGRMKQTPAFFSLHQQWRWQLPSSQRQQQQQRARAAHSAQWRCETGLCAAQHDAEFQTPREKATTLTFCLMNETRSEPD